MDKPEEGNYKIISKGRGRMSNPVSSSLNYTRLKRPDYFVLNNNVAILVNPQTLVEAGLNPQVSKERKKESSLSDEPAGHGC